jgi:oxalate---CoA ligase
MTDLRDPQPPYTVAALMASRARQRGRATALRDAHGSPLSYQELEARTHAVAALLQDHNVQKGDRVVVPVPNTPDGVLAVLGAMRTAIAVPVDPSATAPERAGILHKVQPAVVLLPSPYTAWTDDPPGGQAIDAHLAWRARRSDLGSNVPHDPEPHDPAVLVATSGSVDDPRLVVLTHAQWTTGARRVVEHFMLGKHDRTVNVMPLFHNHGLNGCVLATLIAGGEVQCPGPIDAASLASWLEGTAPTWLTAAPTALRAVSDAVNASARLTGSLPLRVLRTSSAPMPVELAEALEDTLGAPVVEVWGLTEAAGQVTAQAVPDAPRRPREPGAVGPARHGFAIAVVNEDGRPCPAGEPGTVLVKGSVMASGYYRDEAATKRLFTDDWLNTRDIGVLDTDGNLLLKGRENDYLNRGGEKIWLPQVDAACRAHPAIQDAMAFDMPHVRLGSILAVALVPVPGAEVDPAELRNFLRGRLPPSHLPRRVEFISDVPVGSTGKPRRRLLAERFGNGDSGTASHIKARSDRLRPPRSPLMVVLAALWCDVLRLDHIDDDADFLASGGDSILATKLIAAVSEVLGVDLPLDIVFHDGSTVETMAHFVALRQLHERGMPFEPAARQ